MENYAVRNCIDRYAIVAVPGEKPILLQCFPGDSLELKTLQKIVEGYIETVPTVLAKEWSGEEGVGTVLIVNDEGKLQGLQLNRWATDISALYNDVIMGNAVLMGVRGEEFIGLTEEAAKNIVKRWGDSNAE